MASNPALTAEDLAFALFGFATAFAIASQPRDTANETLERLANILSDTLSDAIKNGADGPGVEALKHTVTLLIATEQP